MDERRSIISESLQHPRRSLGNRYRSQAKKFLKIAGLNPNNLSWAEQNARQSVLYDFTNPQNWRILVKIKVEMGDSDGVRAVLEDLITVLGRDPGYISQLEGIDLLGSSEAMLEGAMKADPLDPDDWWQLVNGDESAIAEFPIRLKRLDVSDPRANILFTRRLERIRENGEEDMFLDLSRYLLSQRPNNHESWEELGRMYERRKDYDQAWLCYDQAQTHFPRSEARDRFKVRMGERVDGNQGDPWKSPGIPDRIEFLERMRGLSKHFEQESEVESKDDVIIGAFEEIELLRGDGRLAEAFFLARRMAAEGDKTASGVVAEILEEMNVD